MFTLIDGNKTYATAILLTVLSAVYFFSPAIASWGDPTGEVAGTVRFVVSPILMGLAMSVAALRHGTKKSEAKVLEALKALKKHR